MARHTASMLMHTQSWLDDHEEDHAKEEEAETSGIEVVKENLLNSKVEGVKYTGWGAVPESQDFERLVKGFYCFRGERVLEMRMENGETVVYEHENGEEDEHFGEPELEDLRYCKDEEAIRNELCLRPDDRPEGAVTLDVFLCRQ